MSVVKTRPFVDTKMLDATTNKAGLICCCLVNVLYNNLQLYILREVIFMVALSKSSSVVLGFSLLKKFYMIIKKSLLEKRSRKHHV